MSPVCTDLLPPHKRIRGSISATTQDDSTEEIYEAYTDPDIDLDVQADIDANTIVAEAAAARKADARVEVDTRIDSEDEVEEEAESSHRGTVEMGVDTVVKPVLLEDTSMHTDDKDSREVVQLGLDEIIQELHDHLEEISSAVMLDRIEVLERDNMRLRAMLGIERELIDSLRCHMAYTQEELRQMHRFHYYDCMEFRRLETYARRRLGYHP
ncbi:hypothetical protein Tco_0095339 [Tanacetum coccineum]